MWSSILRNPVLFMQRHAHFCQDAAASRGIAVRPFLAKRRFWRRLASGVVTLCAVLVVLELAAIGDGTLHLASDGVSRIGLALCGTTPCFKGVTPGLTRWAEARTILARLADSQGSDERILVPLGADGTALLYPSIHQGTVEDIDISLPPEERPTAGEMVELYGRPCGLTLSPQSGMLTIRYPGLSADTTVTTDDRLAVNAPVTHVRLLDPGLYVHSHGDPCVADVSGTVEGVVINRAWLGFSSMR